MKIAISATKPSIEAPTDQRFGRCPFFIIVEPDTMSIESVENQTATLGSGAGIQAARLLAEKGVSTVLTGNCGPNAWDTLTAAEIEVFVGCSGSVSDVIEKFKAGEFSPAESPNAQGHAGDTAAAGNDGALRSGLGRGMGGRRQGMGRGRGLRFGRESQ